MKIEIKIDGKEKLFTTDVIPMRVRRIFYKLEKESKEKHEENTFTIEDEMNEEDVLIGMLVETVFNNQFTADQLIDGTSDEYFYSKVREAVHGEVNEQEEPKEVDEEGN